ncbi:MULTISPECIES: LCP family protein [Paenibacillus]|uniref:LCP family glycopolymer transferase n=1 Tax=Paenibacillus TaxID=44249 RepID=UPI00227F6E8D|nr:MULTISPECIES: LCP family protein [Paenibacillus]MCY7486353.1 LCP family protein [Paenibacillus alvei]
MQINKRLRRWHKVVLILLGILILVAAAFLLIIWHMLKGAADAMYEPLPNKMEGNLPKQQSFSFITPIVEKKNQAVTAPTDHRQPNLAEQPPFTLLLIGTDERPGDKGRSDSLALVLVQPRSGTLSLLSIPRDTRTEIVGHHTVDKINHAYAFGGVPMTVATVEQLMKVPVHYYVKTNMNGFASMIDLLGGIEVENSHPFIEDGISIPQGKVTLKGKEALVYVRMRKQDPNGDFGRMQRQRQVLQALLSKSAQLGSASRWMDLLEQLKDNFRTNLQFDDWQELMVHYRPQLQQVEQHVLQGEGRMINGIYFFIPKEAQLKKLAESLRNQLGS